MKGKLNETPFETYIQQIYGGFVIHIRRAYICVTQL